MLKKIDLNFISLIFLVSILPLDLSFLSRETYTRSSTVVDNQVILSNLFEIIVWGILYVSTLFIFLKKLNKIKRFYNQNLLFLLILFFFLIGISVSFSLDIYILRGLDFYLWCVFIILFFSIISLANLEDWKKILNSFFKASLLVFFLNLLFAALFPEISFSEQNRLQGFYGNANSLARFACIVFILAISNYGFKILRISNLLNTFVLLTCLIVVLSTGSATAIFGLMLIISLAALQYLNIKSAPVIFSFIFIVGLAVYSFILVTSPDFLFSLVGRDSSLSGRDLAWSYAVEYISSINIFGYGLSDTRYIFEDAYISSTNMHNNFLEFYFRTGSFGLSIHIIFIIMAALNLFSSNKIIVLSYILIFLFISGLLNSIAFSIRTLDGLLYWTLLFYFATNGLNKKNM